MAKNDFQYGGWNSYTLQCGTIMTLISRGGWWLHPAMWHVALRSWQWIQQVAVGLPCNMTRGSGMTCHWIRQVAAPCNVAVGSGMTCHWICPNVRHIRILLLVSISAISPLSTCHSAPVCEILYKSDHPWQKKTRSALGRAHVPPTKVFRRMSRHSRVDYSNAVFAVSGKLVGPLLLISAWRSETHNRFSADHGVYCQCQMSMYVGTHLHRKLPFVFKRGSN